MKDVWDAHAKADPLWAVLSVPGKKGRQWDIQEFMKAGESEIAVLFHKLSQLGQPVPAGPALDFGCGVGRLTQALGRRFDDVTGADISPAMIALADRLNRYPDRVRYHCTADADLDTMRAGAFGFIYSNIVLQHIAPAISKRYVSEFFRLLAPGGLVIFQVPSHRQVSGDIEIVPMTEDAYSGTIALAGSVPATAGAGEEIPIPILVRNTSSRTWSQPGAGPMAAGNHWLDASGSILQQDDARAPLPQVLRGGAECHLVLRMRVPAAPGRYIAEIDLVHEGVTWFERKGSPTLRFPIEAREGGVTDRDVPEELPVPDYPDDILPSPDEGPVAEPEPFEMHAVPRDEVLAIIARHGGKVIEIEEDRRAGADWVSYAYFVRGPG